MLHEFVAAHRDEIITRCRAKVATRSSAMSAGADADHGVPIFLEQLVTALQMGLESTPEIASSAGQHGHDLLAQGFTISQVVHDYGDVCQSITELAAERNAPIPTDDFRMLNYCLDDAIAGAVSAYGRERNQSIRDEEIARGSERLGYLVHELRNLVNTSILAFEVLKSGNVGVAGSTGSVLNRSLLGLRALVGRSLAEIRLTHGVQNWERFAVAPFIDELELFRPFEQRGNDRTGLGLGLAFSRWGADANHGRIYARSLAARGCVFTLDLPRMQSPPVVTNH